jgi:hypothetical protein
LPAYSQQTKGDSELGLNGSFQEVNASVRLGDVDAAKRNMDLLEREIERLEEVQGR